MARIFTHDLFWINLVLFKDEEFIPFQYLNGKSEHSRKVDCFVLELKQINFHSKNLKEKSSNFVDVIHEGSNTKRQWEELFIRSFFQAMNLNNVWFVLNKFYRDMNSNYWSL